MHIKNDINLFSMLGGHMAAPSINVRFNGIS